MDKYTKETPGCYHSLIKYLATKENTDTHKILKFTEREQMLQPKTKYNKPKLMYYSNDVNVVDEEGKSHPYVINSVRYDNPQRGIIPNHFLVKTMKVMSDFTTIVKGAGKYNDSLGNGWSQNVPMYQVDNHYFADMDCACR